MPEVIRKDHGQMLIESAQHSYNGTHITSHPILQIGIINTPINGAAALTFSSRIIPI